MSKQMCMENGEEKIARQAEDHHNQFPQPFCDCCEHGNHTSRCVCDGYDCCHPQSHFRGNPPDRSTFPELVGVGEILGMLDVSRRRAQRLMRRDEFPQPVARLKSGAVYLLAEVEEYHRNRNRKPGNPGWIKNKGEQS
jgi:hypothetical protein